MDIEKILTLLQSEYPQSFSNMDARTMTLKLELWRREFENDSPELVYAAVRTYMRTPARFAPTIGQVREIMNNLTKGDELQEQKAWAMVSAACRNGLYGYKTEFEKLPPDVQAAVGAPEQLKAWAMMDADTVESVVASNFMRNYRACKEREKARAALPPDVKAFIDGLSEKMKIGCEDRKAIEKKKAPSALPAALKPMVAAPKAETKTEPMLTQQSEYKPMDADEWTRKRDELLAKLSLVTEGE